MDVKGSDPTGCPLLGTSSWGATTSTPSGRESRTRRQGLNSLPTCIELLRRTTIRYLAVHDLFVECVAARQKSLNTDGSELKSENLYKAMPYMM